VAACAKSKASRSSTSPIARSSCTSAARSRWTRRRRSRRATTSRWPTRRACAGLPRRSPQIPRLVWNLTIKRNTVAVVTDGSAVLGLGDIGPAAAMPVMEGKAQLFKEFGGVDAWPICLDTKDTERSSRRSKRSLPASAASTSRTFQRRAASRSSERLRESLDIPVFHDDQHGTAVVVLAAFLNALRVVGKRIDEVKVVVTGVGAAGVAVTETLQAAGVRHVIGVDSSGTIYRGPARADAGQRALRREHQPDNFVGRRRGAGRRRRLHRSLPAGRRDGCRDPLDGPDAVVFAMANPTPEVMPAEIAASPRWSRPVARTSPTRSTTCWPSRASSAARSTCARADHRANGGRRRSRDRATVGDGELAPDYIVPSVFNVDVVAAVAAAVSAAADEDGVSRRVTDHHSRQHRPAAAGRA
jgi:malate dehydrogenase (oxaloacetate-decarboxylating)